jgi:hypothetical protein
MKRVCSTTLIAALLGAGAVAACSGPSPDQLGGGGSGGSAADPNAAQLPGSGSGGGTSGSGSGSGTGATAPVNTNPPGDVGNVTIHRLNAAEYDNTVRDLLGDTTHPSSAFPPDDGINSFTNNADALSISPLSFAAYETAADTLATNALANPAIMTCDGTGAAGANACATQIIAPFLKRAWRRPVTTDEVAGLAALVQVAAMQSQPFSQGIQLAIKAALLSPNFLFRVELDPDPTSTTPHVLSDYELASRLSYFLWSSMPDDALLASADSGKLSSSMTELDAQVARMLADSKSRAMLDNFASEWLNHTLANAKPDPTLFPAWNEDLRAAMAEETKQFVGSFLFGDQSLKDMMDASFTYVNGTLASYYGVTGVTGADFVRVQTPATSHRGGIFTQGSILTMTSIATRTSPVRRGEWVLTDILCDPPPPPPPNVPSLPAVVTTGTMRQQLAQHRADPACASCHTEMDPIGLAFEHYDAIGRWRDTDNGVAIDTTGTLLDGSNFDGAAQLAALIKEDPRFISCTTGKLFSYALGREPQAYDSVRVDALGRGLADTQYRAKSLITNIIHNDAFRMRHGGN